MERIPSSVARAFEWNKRAQESHSPRSDTEDSKVEDEARAGPVEGDEGKETSGDNAALSI